MSPRLRLLLWLIPLVIAGTLIYKGRIHRGGMVDFGVYRVAATRALAGEPLYREDDGHYKFKYMPAFAMAMAPFALIGLEPARALWFALSVGLLILYIRLAILALPDRRLPMAVLAVVTIVVMAKFYGHELTLGQTNILQGVLIVAAMLAAARRRPYTAGLLAGVAVFVKPYAIVLLPWILAACGLGPAIAAGAVVVGGLLLPAVVYGWTGNLELLAGWYRTVTGSTASTLVGNDSISMASMWGKWLGVGPPATALAVATGVALLGVVAGMFLRRGRIGGPEYVEVASLMLLIPLLSPQGWDYVLLLGTPAVACLADRILDLTWPWRVVTAVTLAVLGLTIYDVLGRELYGRFMALSFVSVSAIVMVLLLARLRLRGLA